LRAPGYSQTGRACPPGCACLSGIARRATTDGFAGRGPVSRDSGRRKKGRKTNGFFVPPGERTSFAPRTLPLILGAAHLRGVSKDGRRARPILRDAPKTALLRMRAVGAPNRHCEELLRRSNPAFLDRYSLLLDCFAHRAARRATRRLAMTGRYKFNSPP
jgi:hypothetical protein